MSKKSKVWSKESDEELRKLIEESRASVNWAEVNKWIADGEPYEEDEEILMFLNKNEPTKSRSNGEPTNSRSKGARRNNTNGDRKQIHGDTFYARSRYGNQMSGKESRFKTSTKGATATGSSDSQ